MTQKMDRLKSRLDELVSIYNVPSFADNDPVGFPKRFSDKRDVEISSLLTSTIGWGRRAMILRNAEKLHAILQHQPYLFVREGDIEAIGEGNIHRTFFGRHLKYYLRGLRALYERFGSLEEFAVSVGATSDPAPAWYLANALGRFLCDANAGRFDQAEPNRCLPSRPDNSALKRFNMALRWLCRRDGVVDPGVWTAISPDKLYIPLDVHSGNTARSLGLLERKQNDRLAVEQLTEVLRRFRPDDPTIYDFALFGAGVNSADIAPESLIPITTT